MRLCPTEKHLSVEIDARRRFDSADGDPHRLYQCGADAGTHGDANRLPDDRRGDLPLLEFGAVPPGFQERERLPQPSTDRPSGFRVTYADPAGRELSLLSGVFGEIPGTPTGRQVTIRGHVAEILSTAAGDTSIARWHESRADGRCSQHAVIATGLDEHEFLDVLASVE